jgi:2-desacetyl-2-hydroxyethyl bacteriochlorophyllide A dehydrogenase
MRAIVYDEPLKFSIRTVSDPLPAFGQVRIRLRATGVCGTDVHLHHGEFFPTYPLTPGHEIVGEVDIVGEGVEHVEPGQLVAVDNIIFCGKCRACRSQRTNFCESLAALGVTHPGGFAELVVSDAHKCFAVDDLPLDVAVLAEPTACALHGMDLLGLPPGSDVLLFGAGPSGMILAQLLASGGAARLTVAARTPFKLELARALGADETVQIRRDDSDGTERRLRELAPDGFDAVIDATGALSMLERCISLTRSGGTVFVYGMAGEEDIWSVRPYEVFRRQLAIKGSFAQAFSFDRGLAVLRSGRVRSDGIVTHRFGLDDYGAALHAAGSDSSCLKAVVEF